MDEDAFEVKQNRIIVRNMFRGKCVKCRRPYDTIHEIVPRSLRPGDWWAVDNMIPICHVHHEWAHNTPHSDVILQALRTLRLREYGSRT